MKSKLTNTCKCVKKYFVHTVHPLHVSATYVAIIRDVHYTGWVRRNVTEVFASLHGYYCIGSCLFVQCTDVNHLKYNDLIH